MLSRRIICNRSLLKPLCSSRPYSSDSSKPYRSGNDTSFDKREHAQEDLYIKQHEQEQLKKLRAEIEAREKDIVDLKEKAKKLEH